MVELVQWSVMWCLCALAWVGVLRYASCPNRQAANAARRRPFEGPVDFPLVSQDSSTSIMKEAFVFALFLPNPGAIPSQLNKRHTVANTRAQLKLEMKLEAADWLKTITQIPEAIRRRSQFYAEAHKTLNIIQRVYLYFMQREKLNNFLCGGSGVCMCVWGGGLNFMYLQ